MIPCSPPSVSPHQEAMAMVQEKASALMNQTKLHLLMFHLQQYRERILPVEELVQQLMCLFDSEVRSWLSHHLLTLTCRHSRVSSQRLMS